MKTIRAIDAMQVVSMALLTAAIPMGYHYGLWAGALFILVSVVKIVAGCGHRDNHLAQPARAILLAQLIYWGVLAVSMLWSSNLPSGKEVLLLKAVLLVVPVAFLLGGASHFTLSRLRYIGYALLLSEVALFFFFTCKAVLSLIHGVTVQQAFGMEFDPRHHAYTALYATVAIAFVYIELLSKWQSITPLHRGLLIATIPLLVCYVALVNSRAGMLAMGLTLVACAVHAAAQLRSWRIGVGLGVAVILLVFVMPKMLPEHINRLKQTTENVKEDARTEINRQNLALYLHSPIVGYGVGDYHTEQVQHYASSHFTIGYEREYNAHNQYMESLLAAGIPGLLALLLMLLLPMLEAYRCHSRYLFFVALCTGILMLNLLFESMLERQMGLLFIGCLLSVIALIMNAEENKFGQVEKK